MRAYTSPAPLFSACRSKLHLVAATLACLLASAAQAQSIQHLRFLGLDTVGAFQVTGTIGAEGSDGFNNGNPLAGISYQQMVNGSPNGAAVEGGYTAFGTFTAGAELAGAAPDFLGTTYGVGSLAFRSGDAALNNSNLTQPGTVVSSLSLVTTPPAATALGLVANTQGFSLQTVWDYGSMLPGESILMALTGSGGSNYVDRLQIRYGANFNTGLPVVSFETQSNTGGMLSRTILGSISPSDIYGALNTVDYISLMLDRVMPTAANPNPAVTASVRFLDAATGTNGNPMALASYTFAAAGQTFQGSGNFQATFANASWVTAVPEPGTVAMWVVGLCGLLLMRIRAERAGH